MNLSQVYDTLYRHYGPQHWWPGETPFEVMVGAILTQNTAWTNVEKAIANLKANDVLAPEQIILLPHDKLAEWLRPSGYFNIKAERLRNFCSWYLEQGEFEGLAKLDTHQLRHVVLSVKGVGSETADDILLYAFERPIFVIDAYTRRLFSRLGLIEGHEGYEHLRHYFEDYFSERQNRVGLFNEYHALIVNHAKDICRKRPLCNKCCLADRCPSKGE